MVVLTCLTVIGGCSSGAGDHQSPVHRRAAEPVAGVAMVRAHPWPTQTETTGDGSLVLTYERGHRCYFREVEPDGAVTGWLRRTHSTCPSLLRLDSGLLGSDSWDFTKPRRPFSPSSRGPCRVGPEREAARW